MLESGWLIPIIFMVVGGSVIIIASLLNKSKPTSDSEEAPKEIEITERFFMSSYRGGFPNSAEPASFGYCAVTEGSFIFVRGTQGAEIGRIPRDAINGVIVGEKHQIAEQLSAQEKLCLGKISASKKDNSSCLVINWKNSDSTNHNSIFEFAKHSDADSSATILKKWIKQQQTPDQHIAKSS
jgi:hypothetical protein